MVSNSRLFPQTVRMAPPTRGFNIVTTCVFTATIGGLRSICSCQLLRTNQSYENGAVPLDMSFVFANCVSRPRRERPRKPTFRLCEESCDDDAAHFISNRRDRGKPNEFNY